MVCDADTELVASILKKFFALVDHSVVDRYEATRRHTRAQVTVRVSAVVVYQFIGDDSVCVCCCRLTTLPFTTTCLHCVWPVLHGATKSCSAS